MITPNIPLNEEDRLKELNLLEILDTLPEKEYDAITQLASEICDVPVSLISLIDEKRQWFKSVVGMNISETPRDIAFCAHAINHPEEIMEVYDARDDIRFQDNPLVNDQDGVIFYTGVPLVTSEDKSLGTLCVIDSKPKQLTPKQRKALSTLAQSVVKSLELRKKTMLIQIQNEQLLRKNELLKTFAKAVSHDLKSPLNNIVGLANLLSETEEPSKRVTQKFGGLIVESANNLKNLIDEILEYSKSESILTNAEEVVDIGKVVSECASHYTEQPGLKINLQDQYPIIKGHKAAWKQIIYNLVSNAIKHNDKELAEISIAASVDANRFVLVVSDNGQGIPKDQVKNILKPFVTLKKDGLRESGTSGIGLASVNNLVIGMRGEMEIFENIPLGSVFKISVHTQSHLQ